MDKLKDLYYEFTSFESSLFRYSLSFSFLLALAPSLLAFVLLFNFASLPTSDLVAFVYRFLPQDLLETFIKYLLNQDYNLIPAIITLITSFWLASRSIYSFLLISANHEKIEEPKWTIRLLSIILFIVLAALILLVVYVSTNLISTLPLVLSFSMVILFTLMYRALSFRKRDITYGVLGAVFSTIAVIATAWIFFWIVKEFTSYESLYGPLASLVVLLLSIYVISSIIYFGYCLNIVYEEAYKKEENLEIKHLGYFRFCHSVQKKLPFTKKR
ncbi:MAG: YhjD/YihY/BrkB family envelope integrity protein [Erysipelotrichaceae bacterium]